MKLTYRGYTFDLGNQGQPMGKDENALCISNSRLENMTFGSYGPKIKNKFFVPAARCPIEYLVNEKYSFVPRSLCETDTGLRQICSYCVINDAGMIGSYTRSKSGGESRLFGNRSIGFGGHITDKDFPDGKVTADSLLAAVRREIDEEVSMPEATYHYIGMLLVTESDDPVHLVHAGLVYEIRLALGHHGVHAKEECISSLGFSSINWTRQHWGEKRPEGYPAFEKWSEILLGVLVNPRTTFFE